MHTARTNGPSVVTESRIGTRRPTRRSSGIRNFANRAMPYPASVASRKASALDGRRRHHRLRSAGLGQPCAVVAPVRFLGFGLEMQWRPDPLLHGTHNSSQVSRPCLPDEHQFVTPERMPTNHRLLEWTRRFLELGLELWSVIPTQVVNPSVSRATAPQGTALTVRAENPSGATVFNPGPPLDCGNGPVECGVGGVPAGAYAPV
jgi:hypothetical protein